MPYGPRKPPPRRRTQLWTAQGRATLLPGSGRSRRRSAARRGLAAVSRLQSRGSPPRVGNDASDLRVRGHLRLRPCKARQRRADGPACPSRAPGAEAVPLLAGSAAGDAAPLARPTRHALTHVVLNLLATGVAAGRMHRGSLVLEFDRRKKTQPMVNVSRGLESDRWYGNGPPRKFR